MQTQTETPKAGKLPALGIIAFIMLAIATCSQGQPTAAPRNPDPGDLRAFIELARSDLKTQKAFILAQNMPLTEEEGAEFWPLQREYETELTKLADERLEIIEDYAARYDTMTDAEASRLARKTFDLEKKKTELKSKYFKRFSKVMPAKKAARFFQIENQLNTAIDLRVAASLPLIK